MKKRMWKLITLVLIAVMLFTGCGAAEMMTDKSSMAYNDAASEVYDGFDYFYDESGLEYEDAKPSAEAPKSVEQRTEGDAQVPESQRKLIRRVFLTTETKEFDSFLSLIDRQMAGYGGYMESSEINGNSYSMAGRSRYANLVIRVPSKFLNEFINQIGNAANIVSKSENSDDVTLKYIDAQSKVKSLEIQRDKLLEWMENTETVEELIQLESRLSEVRYEIEYYGAILRNYDNLVEFSTITLSVREVERITVQEPETVGDRIGKGLSDNLYSIGEGIKNFAVWFVTSLPYLLIWAVVIVVIVLIIKGIVKKAKKKKQERWGAYQNQYNQGVLSQQQPNGQTPPDSTNPQA